MLSRETSIFVADQRDGWLFNLKIIKEEKL